MDQIDTDIIKKLKINGKLTNTDLANNLHISSQAIGKRRKRLEDSKFISNYTISSSIYKTAFIEVYMNKSNFEEFELAIVNVKTVSAIHKISGSYCYLLIFEELTADFDNSLQHVVKQIESYGRYKINTSMYQVQQ